MSVSRWDYSKMSRRLNKCLHYFPPVQRSRTTKFVNAPARTATHCVPPNSNTTLGTAPQFTPACTAMMPPHSAMFHEDAGVITAIHGLGNRMVGKKLREQEE
ncbi:hypothetical protein AVEN_160961-1 [Araneus ventricosus]|uniref:Uncharacterized protein n=1 Tax=Araneus ventricosus TaxID=182803 RepID=A0A4Y2LMG5_ARAVE|nr:hypothetical protein AVEN_160961-1 [Araneus ventricosus]